LEHSADVAKLVVQLTGEHGMHYGYSLGNGHRDGTLTISKYPLNDSASKSYFVPCFQGGWNLVECITPAGPIEILNVYAPRLVNQRTAFFLSKLPTLNNNSVHVGDHQTTLDAHLDRVGCTSQGGHGAFELQFYNRINHLTDAFRHLHPNNHHHTWMASDGKSGTYIDRTFISEDMIDTVEKCTAVDLSLKKLKLDHKCVLLDLRLEDRPKSKSRFFWSDNLLLNEQFASDITMHIQEAVRVFSDLEPGERAGFLDALI
jgi:exonuclease III